MPYLKLNNKYIGVEPKFPNTVYTNRDKGGAWEELILSPNDNSGVVGVLFKDSNRQLSINPSGGLETRAPGTFGEYEQLVLKDNTISRVGVTLQLEGYNPSTSKPLHLEVKGNDFIDEHGNRIVIPGVDAFFAFRQYRDGGLDALKPFLEESNRLGFKVWRMWSQGSKAQNTVDNLYPTEAGYYDDIRPCTDLINSYGIIPLWTCFVDNQDVQSPLSHWTELANRLAGASVLLSGFNQWTKNKSNFGPDDLPNPGHNLIWSRGSAGDVDNQVPPKGASFSELHATRNSFERALMDATASPFNMRSVSGSTLVAMTEGNPFGDSQAYSEHQSWELGRAYSIEWGLAVYHNRQSQRKELMHDDTAKAGAAWVRGMQLN